MQATDPHCKALLWELSAWMSEGSDREQKPVTHKRETTASGADRPKRLTRRDVDYSNSGEGGSVPGQQQLQGVVYREVSQQSSLRGIRESSTESIWGGSASDNTNISECWSPRTVERRTGILFEGVREVQLQIQQLRMSKKEEMSVTDLMKMMLEMSSRDKEDARKTEEE